VETEVRSGVPWLAGDLSDEVEVLVKVQYGQSSEFSSRGDDEIRYRRSTTLAPVREEGRDLDCQRSSRSATGVKSVSEPTVDLVRSADNFYAAADAPDRPILFSALCRSSPEVSCADPLLRR
jgi:hypothetical protein